MEVAANKIYGCKTHSLRFQQINGFDSFQLPPPPSLFQPPPSSLQHTERCKNQNIARNWAVSTNLGRKIQSCSFCLKIGTNGILEELILHLDLDFRNFDPKILCWINLGRKHQSCPFCLKIGTQGQYLEDADTYSDISFLNLQP